MYIMGYMYIKSYTFIATACVYFILALSIMYYDHAQV